MRQREGGDVGGRGEADEVCAEQGRVQGVRCVVGGVEEALEVG